MRPGGNSKKLPPKFDLLTKPRIPEKLGSGTSINELKEIFKDYKQREARLLREIDRGWEDLNQKENDKAYLKSTKSQLRKKSSLSVQRTPKNSQVTGVFSRKVIDNSILKPPMLTCRNWVTIDADSMEVVYGCRSNEEREMASITKVMTCLLTLEFVNEYRVDVDKTHYLVSKKASVLGGTTANLRKDDYVCIRDLLHGLMLPSGNDAAQTLAENVVTHRVILDRHGGCDPNSLAYDEEVPTDATLDADFYKLMNQKARQLGMFHTNYDSSHGLANELNVSTCVDQAKLAVLAMKNPDFRDVVKTSYYTGIIERDGRDVELVWRNTNKLLERKGYLGIKTGITGAAGGCLCSAYQNKGINVVTVVLGSRDQSARFSDTEAIHNWIATNQKELSALPLEERIVD